MLESWRTSCSRERICISLFAELVGAAAFPSPDKGTARLEARPRSLSRFLTPSKRYVVAASVTGALNDALRRREGPAPLVRAPACTEDTLRARERRECTARTYVVEGLRGGEQPRLQGPSDRSSDELIRQDGDDHSLLIAGNLSLRLELMSMPPSRRIR